MFMTLTGELSWQRWDDQPLTFTRKRRKSLFEPPFKALRGNVRTPSMARWKARDRLYIGRNWTFFAISYGWDVMSGNRSKSALFEGGGWVNLSTDFRGKRASPTNHCWYQSSRVIALSCGIKISAVRHLVLSQSTRVTDRQTDGRTDRITTPKTALAYARAVKTETDEQRKSETDQIVRERQSGRYLRSMVGSICTYNTRSETVLAFAIRINLESNKVTIKINSESITKNKVIL